MLYRPEVIDHAVITYYPKTGGMILCNENARLVLCPGNAATGTCPVPGDGKDAYPDVPSLCEKWKNSLEDLLPKKGACREAHMKHILIDKYISGRRSYSVWGCILTTYLPCVKGRKYEAPCYMFVLNRSIPGEVNLSEVCRKKKLNRRERDIVRLLMEDRGNKEIADILGLSLHTVRGYMKSLMLKLGVGSRAGVLGQLLAESKTTDRNDSPES